MISSTSALTGRGCGGEGEGCELGEEALDPLSDDNDVGAKRSAWCSAHGGSAAALVRASGYLRTTSLSACKAWSATPSPDPCQGIPDTILDKGNALQSPSASPSKWASMAKYCFKRSRIQGSEQGLPSLLSQQRTIDTQIVRRHNLGRGPRVSGPGCTELEPTQFVLTF